MKTILTYGTYDLLHYGHIRLLKRAKELGDYLIVGITADDFDKTRGKINVQQSLMERVEAVRETGIADEIIIEEYEGQKIDDIRRYGIDIFTVGSDWKGYFDYLSEYCKVVYLERTQGISSSEIREKRRLVNLGLVGDSAFLNKIGKETYYVNGIQVSALCTNNPLDIGLKDIDLITDDFNELLKHVDAVYIRSLPKKHFGHIKKALENGKHVLCEKAFASNSKEVNKMISCRTSDLGYSVYECPDCGELKFSYHTCKSRFCPSCGNKYVRKRTEAILQKCYNGKHRHIVFTISDFLWDFFRKDRKLIDLLFQAVSKTILSWFKDKYKSQNYIPGIIAVLHTYGRNMKWHPHIHTIVTEGAMGNLNIFKKETVVNDWIIYPAI